MLLLDPREERSRPLADSATMAAADEGLQKVGNASNLQCRTKLMSQGWHFTKQIGDAIRTQVVGSLCSSRKIRGYYCGKRSPMPSYSATRCPRIAWQKSLSVDSTKSHKKKSDQSHKVRQRLFYLLTDSVNKSKLTNQMQVVGAQSRSVQGDPARLLLGLVLRGDTRTHE